MQYLMETKETKIQYASDLEVLSQSNNSDPVVFVLFVVVLFFWGFFFFFWGGGAWGVVRSNYLGHHRPAIEMPLKWRFAGGQMLALH